ncbi:MAG: prolipoprotein diacylglyceryl transferase [Chloroflexi bacterium]|nr:prolipoprotein diacylglyceryl transferase [Chloroflexota bacterium]
MLDIGLSPNLVGGITWHGLFTALAVAVGVVFGARLARNRGMDEDIVFNVAMWAVPGGVIGSRLVHVIDRWGFYKNNLEEIFFIWNGGVALFGAILGGTIAGVAYAWVKGYPIGKLADMAAPSLLISQAVGRVGDLINGEHFSKTTDLPWAWVHTHPDWPGLNHRTLEFPGGLPAIPVGGDGAAIGYHPSVAYEMMADVLLFFFIWRLLGKVSPDGMVMLIYLALYSLVRFGIQFTRADPERLGALQQAHVISLIVFAIALLFIIYLLIRRQTQARAAAT